MWGQIRPYIPTHGGGDMACRHLCPTPFLPYRNANAKMERGARNDEVGGKLVKSPGLSAKHAKP